MNNLKDLNDKEIESVIITDSTLPQNTETAALAYAAAGLSVIPLRQDKRPIGEWKQYQQQIASSDEIHRWFHDSHHGVGVVCGSVSGNLEVLDFDEKYNLTDVPIFDQWKELVDTHCSGLVDRLVLETTQTDGVHALYYCDTIEGNQKLASRPTTEEEQKKDPNVLALTIIETRGQGGYIMCAPSTGYKLIQGSFSSVPRITPDERTRMFEAAHSLNLYADTNAIVNIPPKAKGDISRPGDNFNLRADIAPVLEDGQWKRVFVRNGTEYWRRPGKNTGISATFNHIQGMFYVFSSSCAPFEPRKAYSKFAVYALLKHKGDFKAAAKELVEEGYGANEVCYAEHFLNERYNFRYNEITSKVEFKKIGEASFRLMGDNELNSFYRELQLYSIRVGLDKLAALLYSNYVPRYNPFVNYYRDLPAWDKTTDYIGQLADTVSLLNKAEQKTFRDYLDKWLVNTVGCALDPVIVNHNALILVGPQGYYKTTWLNSLVPKDLSSYKFVGTINPNNKDTLIQLSECYLINLDELETLSKHDLGSLKSIMTLQHINVRRPYGHFSENYVRRASFVGSINKTEFLNDETGSRRFLTFEVESININHSVDMNKVHSQAYALFKNGFRFWFDQAEIQAVNARNKNYTVQSTEDELVAMYLQKVELDENKKPTIPNLGSVEWLTATEIAQRMKGYTDGYAMTTNSARCFGTAMMKAGFGWEKSGGKRYAVIAPPAPTKYFGSSPVAAVPARSMDQIVEEESAF